MERLRSGHLQKTRLARQVRAFIGKLMIVTQQRIDHNRNPSSPPTTGFEDRESAAGFPGVYNRPGPFNLYGEYMEQQNDTGPVYYYWRGILRDTTKAVLPNFVEELPPAICVGSLRSKLGAVTRLGRGNVVIIDSWGKDALLLSLSKAVFGFRLVLRLRGDPIAAIRSEGTFSEDAKVRATRFILGRADMLIFNSKHLHSQQDYRRYSAKSHVIYNPLMYRHVAALRTDEQNAGPAGLRILSVMSFGCMKKIRPLGEAVASWVDEEFLTRNDIIWTICGIGENTDAYRWFVRKVSDAGHGERIEFIGYQEDMPAQYAAHDVLAHLSGLEAFPNAVLEASCYELPTITIPESGGTLEAVLDEETGRIVADGPAFREAILTYRASPQLRRAHGRNARAHVSQNFSIERQKDAMTALLRGRFGERARHFVA